MKLESKVENKIVAGLNVPIPQISKGKSLQMSNELPLVEQLLKKNLKQQPESDIGLHLTAVYCLLLMHRDEHKQSF